MFGRSSSFCGTAQKLPGTVAFALSFAAARTLIMLIGQGIASTYNNNGHQFFFSLLQALVRPH
jgi:hypothetical protein